MPSFTLSLPVIIGICIASGLVGAFLMQIHMVTKPTQESSAETTSDNPFPPAD